LILDHGPVRTHVASLAAVEDTLSHKHLTLVALASCLRHDHTLDHGSLGIGEFVSQMSDRFGRRCRLDEDQVFDIDIALEQLLRLCIALRRLFCLGG
jgi:hypothetical protein